MAKVQRPKGAGTRSLRVRLDGEIVEVRFDDNGEAEVEDKFADKLVKMYPSLSTTKKKKGKPEPPPATNEPPIGPVEGPSIEENE